MTSRILGAWRRPLAVLLLATAAVAGAAAATPAGTAPAATVTLVSIALSPLVASVAPGGTSQLTVIGTYSNGTTKKLPAAGETFRSSNAAVVTVSAGGLATVAANAPGAVQVTVSATDDASGLTTSPANSTVITTKAVLLSIVMNPLAVQVAAGNAVQLHVAGLYSDGSSRPLQPTAETFHTSNAAVVTVNTQGVATVAKTAIGGTVVTVSATDRASGLRSSPANSTVITVQPTLVSIAVSPLADTLLPGTSVQLSVIGTLTDGSLRVLPISGESFQSSATAIVTVTTGGLATVAANAPALATATITATDEASGDKSSPANSSVITVETALTSVALSPLAVSQVPGGSWQLTVTGTYNNGQVVVLNPAGETFTVSGTGVATVDASGILHVASGAAAKSRVTIGVTDTASGIKSTTAHSTVLTVPTIGKPPNANSVGAVEATVSGNPLCTAIAPFYWEIGDKEGAMVSGSQGADANGNPVLATTQYPVASATKWLYAAYVAQWRGAAANLTTSDITFLHFTSGYSNMGNLPTSCDGASTATQCLAFTDPEGLTFGTQNPATVGLFDYDGGHMENHGVRAGTPLANLAYGAYATTVGGALGATLTLAFSQPLLPGGAYADSNNYGLFLRNILAGTLYLNTLLGTSPVCTSIVDCPTTVAYSPIPEAWHYSIGHWVEDDPTTNGDGAFSSPGSYGYYPWIDSTKTYYGLVARSNSTGEEEQEGYRSAQCGRLLRAAWTTGVVQTGTIPSARAARP